MTKAGFRKSGSVTSVNLLRIATELRVLKFKRIQRELYAYCIAEKLVGNLRYYLQILSIC